MEKKLDNLEFEKHFKARGFASQRRYPNEPMVQFLAEHYFPLSPALRKKTRILEVGCGSGANLWVIAREGFDAYGIDIAKSALPLAKQMLRGYGTSAKLQVGNMRSLPYANNFFDAVIDVLSIEHTTLKGHEQAFAEIFRTLKPGGRFFSWHLGAESVNFKKGGGKKLDRYTTDDTPNQDVPYPNNGTTCFLTAPLARKMLKAAGFAHVRIERVMRTYKEMTQEVEYFAISARKP